MTDPDRPADDLLRLLDAVERHDAGAITVGCLRTFLSVVALQDRIASGELVGFGSIAREVGVSYPGFVRHLDVLGDGYVDGGLRRKGLGFVRKVRSPVGRSKVPALTPAGLEFLAVTGLGALSRPPGPAQDASVALP